MMGRLNHDQGQLFYSFSLEEIVPDDHLVRKIAAVLDLSWVRADRTTLRSRVRAMSGFVRATFSAVSSSMSCKRAWRQGWSAAKDLQSMPA